MVDDRYRDRFLTDIETIQTPGWNIVEDFESAMYRLSQEADTTPRDELLQTFATAVAIQTTNCLKQNQELSITAIVAVLEHCAEESLDLDRLKQVASSAVVNKSEDEAGLFEQIDQIADSPLEQLQYELLLSAGAAQLNSKITPEDTHDHLLITAASFVELDGRP